MEVNVMMTRKVAEDMHSELMHYLMELRQLALKQKGYIGGRTFVNVDEKDDVLVISTWASKENWDNWFRNEKRKELMSCIDAMLLEPTTYKVYLNL